MKRRRNRRRCALCREPFGPLYPQSKYCSIECRRVAQAQRQSRGRGKPNGEDFYATRSAEALRMIVSTYRRRGYREVGPRASIVGATGPQFAAWNRGGGLYLVRAWSREILDDDAEVSA